MEIPGLPRVPIDMDERTRRNLFSLEGRINVIDVVGIEGGDFVVLGRKDERNCTATRFDIRFDRATGSMRDTNYEEPLTTKEVFALLFTFGLYSFTPNMARRVRRREDYERRIDRYEEENLQSMKDRVKDIRVYQGTIDEIERELGRPLQRVDTGKPETFLRAGDTFWLRVKAYSLGANAIVHFQPGSSIGTPVRYVNK